MGDGTMDGRLAECLVIAEAGVNHNGSLEMALALIDAAADAGADIVKFQTFKASSVISRQARKAKYQEQTTGEAGGQLEMVRKLELTAEDHRRLLEHSATRRIEFLSTPFDVESARFLVDGLGLQRLKIPSGEITNAVLLHEIASLGKPVIMSTGMSTLGEIEDALGVLAFGYLGLGGRSTLGAFREAYASDAGQAALNENVCLMHCTTEYPAPFANTNLRAIETLQRAFGLPVGFSDHTEGTAVAIGAAALGANIIEKHMTLDRSLPGPDHRASLEPPEFASMVAGIRQIGEALGSGRKYAAAAERKNIEIARKSLVAARAIRKGESFSEQNVAVKRPGNGASPFLYWDLLGRCAGRDYDEDDLIDVDMLRPGLDSVA